VRYVKEITPEPLKILQIIARYGEVKGKLALHKLIYTLQSSRTVDLGYRFINYSFGPYSKELEDDLKLLASLGLIAEEKKGDALVIRVTRKGMEVVKSFSGARLSPFRVRA